MKEFNVIIPIHEYNDSIKEMLEKAMMSVPNDIKIVIVVPSQEVRDLIGMLTRPLTIIQVATKKNCNGTFSELVNEGFEIVKLDKNVKYAYLLEFDDMFNELWFNEVKREIIDKPDVSVFLPLTEIIDFNTNKFLSYGNEAPWASSFSEEIGYIDNESLQQFFDFYLTGSVFNVQDWHYVGGLKESFKLSFWYEFLLRLTHNDKKAYVIPKLGYKHYVNRPNALHMSYAETMSEDETKWWYNLALEEYMYKKDNKKTYTQDK